MSLTKLIPRQVAGEAVIMASAESVNLVVDFINALKRMEGRNGIKIHFAQGNIVIEGEEAGEVSASGEASTGGAFRGLWASGETHSEYQEMWKVAAGQYAGTYVCVNSAGSSSDPWSGVDWVMIAPSSAFGPIGPWT